MKKNFLLIIILFVCNLPFIAQTPDNDNFIITHGPYLQNIDTKGVTVIWTTNKPAIPGVRITAHDGKTWFVRNSRDGIIDGGGLLHKVRVEGLEPGTAYKYSIHSVQVLKYQAYKVYFGDTLVRKQESFSTFPLKKEQTAFVVINDIHDNSAKLASYLKNATLEEKDLVIFNGDMVDYFQTPEQLFKGFIDTAAFYFAANKPFYYIRGNHETRGYMARDLKGYFDFADDSFYYGFNYGPVRFTVLDCGEDKPDDNRFYYGLADYNAYRLEELEWLRQEVKSEGFRNAKYRVVIIHMPIIRQEKQGYGMKFLSENFGPILQNAGINLVISAHTHRNTFYDAGNSGFGFPVLVNSNNSFIEVFADQQDINIAVKDIGGKIINEYNVK